MTELQSADVEIIEVNDKSTPTEVIYRVLWTNLATGAECVSRVRVNYRGRLAGPTELEADDVTDVAAGGTLAPKCVIDKVRETEESRGW